MTTENLRRPIEWLAKRRGKAVYGLIGLALLYTTTDRINSLMNTFNDPSTGRAKEGLSFNPYTTPSGYRLSVVYTEGRRPIPCGDGLPAGYTQIISTEVVFALEKGQRLMSVNTPTSSAVPPRSCLRTLENLTILTSV